MLFALWDLLRNPKTGLTIGIASRADQARIIYDRTTQLLRAHPALASRFAKLTDTRGIKTTEGARYEIKATNADALQGLAITLGVCDELHLLPQGSWSALVKGTGARPNTLVVGITTAGDMSSELLLHLYENGAKALAGDADFDRFGFFVWEAPEARIPEDRAELVEWVKLANPSVASGRMDLESKLKDMAGDQPSDVVRYDLNRFVASVNAFIDIAAWSKCQRELGEEFPQGRAVYAFDVTPGWDYLTVSAAIKVGDVTHTELVAWVVKPTGDQVVRIAERLAKRGAALLVLDGYQLKKEAERLTQRGYQVKTTSRADIVNASSRFYGKVIQRRIKHAGDPLLSVQVPNTVRKNVDASFRIVGNGEGQIDAVMATVLAVHGAEEAANRPGVQVF